jgi:hypothetical protein
VSVQWTTVDERRHDVSTPVEHWFLIEGTPAGGAPLDVRAQWQGVLVPVREPRPVESPMPFRTREILTGTRRVVDDGVPVLVDDALRALELFERPAYTWWHDELAPPRTFDRIVFRTQEGRFLLPPIALRLFPELADF